MLASFRISTTSGFDREVRHLHSGNPKLVGIVLELKSILNADPYNRTRLYDIKKLKNVPVGEGRYRIRSGRYRLRYDIIGDHVILYSFKHRREAY